jgi:tocopherol O-methyltransferase
MTLNEKIGHFYDSSTKLWLDVWGEHMHHGYYGADGKEKKDRQQAQNDLIQHLLDWGGIKEAPALILDAGCGVGGSARFLARRFGAQVHGLTLSNVQAEEARSFNEKAQMGGQITIAVRDMLTLTPEDGSYDLVWSMESAEHIPAKKQLMKTFNEVLKPGGKLLMATWCIRETPPPFSAEAQKVLERIGSLYHIPPMISLERYEKIMTETGYVDVQSADWTMAVSPFWKAVLQSAKSASSVLGLLRAGWPAIRGAWALQYMIKGYEMGLLKFGVIQGTKA